MQLKADIILLDTIGLPYNGKTPTNFGMGGSEFQAILLLEEFAKLGKRVICLNNTVEEIEYNNVLYLSNMNVFKYKFSCDHLILHRNSIIPNKINYKNCYQWITDNNTYDNLRYYDLIDKNKCKLITLSKYSNDQYPDDWNKNIINFIIPDYVYDLEIPSIKKNYIYASSLMKGYQSTYETWRFLKKQTDILNDKFLNVCLPGYDNPINDISDKKFKINYLYTLPFKQVVELIAKCEGMFYVNTMQETFCISAVLCEILQTTPYIYCLNGTGALKEVLNSDTISTNCKKFFNDLKQKNLCKKPKDYRSKLIISKWLQIMN